MPPIEGSTFESDSVDLAYQRLLGCIDSLTPIKAANEAETRLKCIDVLLITVLGWDRSSIEVEKYCRPGYADYVTLLSGKPRLVVEAKRENLQFFLESMVYDKGLVPSGLILNESKEAHVAVSQAIGYAASLGASLSVASNGIQWIVAMTHVAGVPLESRNVLVFESCDAIKARFRQFYDALSPEGLSHNRAAGLLSASSNQPPPAKSSSRIPNYPAVAHRNRIGNEISYVLDMVWAEVKQEETEREFLEKCYVVPSHSEASLDFAYEMITQRRGLDRRQVNVVSIGDGLERAFVDGGDRPVLVLGRIGHGKTTFLRYLRHVKARELFEEGYIQLDIDFLDEPAAAGDVSTFVYRRIEAQLRDVYDIDPEEDGIARGALNLEIERFRKSPRGVALNDNSEELKKAELKKIESIVSRKSEYYPHLMRHLKRGRNKSVVIFLDNLDRRDDDIQEAAFLRASAIAKRWECLVFLCVRPDTFHRSKQFGVLDSLSPTTIDVVSPDPAVLLKKRFDFAANVARGEERGFGGFRAIPSRGMSFDLKGATAFFECCRDSFWENRKLDVLFEAVSNGNVRLLLEQVRGALTGSHLDTRKILARIPDGYRIPTHEMVRALIYGNYAHYQPRGNVFINLFDIDSSARAEHFLAISTIDYLCRKGQVGTDRKFIRYQDTLDYLTELGFSGDVSVSCIGRLEKANCVESATTTNESPAAALRATSLGTYHIRTLVRTFAYIDAVIVDTPIVNEGLRADVFRRPELRGIEDRVIRVERFLVYLDSCAGELGGIDVSEAWREIRSGIEEDIGAIRRREGF